MRIFYREAIRYAIASGLAFALDVALLTMMVQYLSWWYVAAASISFAAGLVLAYALSVSCIFTYRRLENRRAEFAIFAVVGIAGLAVNAAVMFAAVSWFGLYYLTGKCIAAIVALTLNFTFRRRWLFLRRAPI